MTSSATELISRFEEICGREHVLTHEHELATYRSDGLLHYRQSPLAAVLPGSGEEVAAVIRACFEAQVPWVARGSGTGLSGGALPHAEGVLIAHGDAPSGYSLYIKDGLLVHDLNIGGGHEIVTSDRKIPPGAHRLGVHVERLVRETPPARGSRTGGSAYTLLIDGEPAGSLQTQSGFHNLISWSGLDIGRDRGSPVSHYDAPFEFTGRLLRVTVAMHNDQKLDGDGVGDAEMARQ